MEKVKVATMDELTPLTGEKVIIKNRQIGIFLTESGRVHATSDARSCKRGSLSEGTASEGHIYCPLHDQEIDLNMGKVQEPDTGRVETYQVEIQDEDVSIYL